MDWQAFFMGAVAGLGLSVLLLIVSLVCFFWRLRTMLPSTPQNSGLG
jgi:hypothetical protein